jgi:hypothetical protein
VESNATAAPREKSRSLTFGIVPSFGFAWGAKDFPDQVRIGMELLGRVGPGTDVGLSLQAGFRDGTLIGGGPLVRRRLSWPPLGPASLNLLGGFSFFSLDTDTGSDLLAGPRFGAETRMPVSGALRGIDLYGALCADVLMFGADRVSIPVTAGIGFAVHF